MIWNTASIGDDITNTVTDVSEALLYPVLILALLAGVVVIVELGRVTVEAIMRSQKKTANFDNVARQAQATAQAGDIGGAQALLKSQAHGSELEKAYIRTLLSPTPLEAERAAIDYDIYASKRLDRVRLLTRAGPALGLMGTLIPLAPALAALGRGDAKVLTDELQTAFSITVIGVGVGLLAFTVALIHERFYSRDLANVDFLRQLRGDMAVVVQSTAPSVATTAVEVPATAVPAVPAASKPQSAQPAAAPAPPATPQPATAPPAPATAPTPTATPATVPTQTFPPAAPAAEPKKKFGLKRKQKPGDAAAFPQPPVAPAPPAPAPPQAGQPPTPGAAPTDKSPSIPTAPSPAQPGQGPDEGDKSGNIPTPPSP